MTRHCALCGSEVMRRGQRGRYFCSTAHRNLWNSAHVNFAAMAKKHKAPHLTELNRRRNPLCSVANRGKANSRKARRIAERLIGRKLFRSSDPNIREVVHHINGNAEDNSPDNLLVMTDAQHRQLHMALAKEKLEEANAA